MDQESVIRILAGGAMALKKTSENLKGKSSEYIKEKVLNNEFVTRDEYNQLRNLVLKLSEEIKSIETKLPKNTKKLH
jgi:hypothetical protein